MGTSVARASAVIDFSKRGSSFNIPGISVDGMDVEAVQAAGAEAMAFCRGGKGPIILEMKTYRYRGHSMSDPAKYRTREEVSEVREKRDPIDHFGQKLVKNGVVSEDDLKMIDKDVRAIITEAAEFATESPEPGLDELYTDVLA
jgi:pyruvate dehydrogenase E1 component subunit alpha